MLLSALLMLCLMRCELEQNSEISGNHRTTWVGRDPGMRVVWPRGLVHIQSYQVPVAASAVAVPKPPPWQPHAALLHQRPRQGSCRQRAGAQHRGTGQRREMGTQGRVPSVGVEPDGVTVLRINSSMQDTLHGELAPVRW